MMLTFGLIALISIAALTAIAVLAWQIADAAPKVAELKTALADCSQTRELRFVVRETLVSPRHGQIVTLPIKLKPVGSAQPLRAAA
jgi:hypothetical protein